MMQERRGFVVDGDIETGGRGSGGRVQPIRLPEESGNGEAKGTHAEEEKRCE